MGKIVAASAAEALVESGITPNAIRNMSVKQLVEQSYELQSYLLFCDSEERQSDEYREKSRRKSLIDSILRSRGYIGMTVYLKEDTFDEIAELSDILENGFYGLYEE